MDNNYDQEIERKYHPENFERDVEEPEETEEFDKLKVRKIIMYLLEKEKLSITGVLAISMISKELEKI